jgi:hypothetical protein
MIKTAQIGSKKIVIQMLLPVGVVTARVVVVAQHNNYEGF